MIEIFSAKVGVYEFFNKFYLSVALFLLKSMLFSEGIELFSFSDTFSFLRTFSKD